MSKNVLKKKRESGKVILMIIEGRSEDYALTSALSKVCKMIDPELKLFSLMVENNDGRPPGGDITSLYGVFPSNIEEKINSKRYIPIGIYLYI